MNELIDFQRDLEAFEQLNAQIIGVSNDSPDDNRKFAAQHGIDFPLVSDTDKTIKKTYGRGRVTYLIDKNGIIRHVQKGVPDNAAFLKRLRQLQ